MIRTSKRLLLCWNNDQCSAYVPVAVGQCTWRRECNLELRLQVSVATRNSFVVKYVGSVVKVVDKH